MLEGTYLPYFNFYIHAWRNEFVKCNIKKKDNMLVAEELRFPKLACTLVVQSGDSNAFYLQDKKVVSWRITLLEIRFHRAVLYEHS